MRRLSLLEFKEMVSERPARYLISWVDQDAKYDNDFIKYELEFSSIAVTLNPNVIMFQSAQNKVYILGVKYVDIDEDDPVVGVIADIYSGDRQIKQKTTVLIS